MKFLYMELTILLLVGVGMTLGQDSKAKKANATYTVSNLSSLGGTISRGNSINNEDWVSGYSFTGGNSRRHAALWKEGGTAIDLGTLAGANGYSTVCLAS